MKLYIEFNSEEKKAFANYVAKANGLFGIDEDASLDEDQNLETSVLSIARKSREDGGLSINLQICPNLATGYLNLVAKHLGNLMKAWEIAMTAFQGMACYEEFAHDMEKLVSKVIKKKAA